MSGLAAVMEAMADRIRTMCAAATPPIAIQVEPRMLPFPSTPTVDIFPGDPGRDDETAAFHDIGGGYWLTVRARIHTADTKAGQDVLLAFMDDEDPLSIAAALDGERQLAGTTYSLDVRGVTGFLQYGTADREGVGAWIGAQWTVLALPARTP